MPDIKALRSYLVSLGFSVNTAQASQFNNAIQTAAQVVNTNTQNIAINMAKWGTAVIAMFEGVGVAVIALMDKTATADQQYRLLGQTMFMDAQHAKTMKIAMDALGLTLNQIAFDPEANRRYEQLQQLQDTLMAQLGPNFAQTMIQVRDAQMEMTKFRVEMLYFRDLLTSQIFQALGGEKLTEKLRSWNEYIVANLPEWSRIVSTYLTPVLTDAWNIMKGLWEVAKGFAWEFTNIIGMLSGDPTLQGTLSFEKFAKALSKVAHWLAVIIGFLSHFAGTIAGAGLGFMMGGPVGALIGGGIGAVADSARFGADITGSTTAGTATAGDTNTAGSGNNYSEAIAHATMMAESGGHQFNRAGGILTSKTGALGIMQLEPGTARQLGVDPYDEAQNLAGGRAYLQQLYFKFGNWHDALAAYNWGPGHVAGALHQHKAFPSDVEGYSQGIMRAANIQVGSINIMQPNASPEQIKNAVAEGIQKHENEVSSANLVELRSMY